MRSNLPFIRPSRVSGAAKGDADNASSRLQGTTARSTALAWWDWHDGWFDGRAAPGRTADMFCEQVRAAVARSKRRGRIAIVITDNLKTHTLVFHPTLTQNATRVQRRVAGSRTCPH